MFRTLSPLQLRAILDIGLVHMENRIISHATELSFEFHCTPEAKEFLIQEGTDARFGARHLKRAIESIWFFRFRD